MQSDTYRRKRYRLFAFRTRRSQTTIKGLLDSKCNVLLTGKKKKYGCAKDCETFYEYENTCENAGTTSAQEAMGINRKDCASVVIENHKAPS